MRRLVTGSVVSLILAGEIIAASGNGIFNPANALILLSMYAVYFSVVDAYRNRYSPTLLQLICFCFTLYSVLITGLLHGELLNFLKPDEVVITTIIRIQASLYMIFVFPIVDRMAPIAKKDTNLKTALVWFFVYFLLLTPSDKIGFQVLIRTVTTAPALSILFITLALGAVMVSVRKYKTKQVLVPVSFLVVLFFMSLVPVMLFFIPYAAVMVLFTVYLVRK